MRCTACAIYYPISTYPIRKERGNLYRDCVLCRRKKSAAWREKNPHKVKISLNNYRIIRRDRLKERKPAHSRKYYEENKEKIKEKMRIYTKTEHHYANRKKVWREWYDIGDHVYLAGEKFRIIEIRPGVWYVIRRNANYPPITVSRKKLVTEKQHFKLKWYDMYR